MGCSTVTSSPSTSSTGCAGSSFAAPLVSSTYVDCRSTPTPLATSTGECRSSPTPLANFTGGTGAYDFIDCSSHTRLPLALGTCLHTASPSPSAFADDTGHATPPLLAASTGGDGRFSPGATTTPTSAMYFTEEEIVRLRALPSGASTSTSSLAPLTEQEIVRLRCLPVPSYGPPSTGSAGSDTDSSGIVRPPSTQAGTSSWILDTGASFHMTHDSSTLSSARPLDSHVHVLTADGTSLPVTGRGTLSTSSFHIPDVAHVPRLTMQLISGGQIVDSGCRVILDFDSCSILDRHTGALLGADPWRHDS